MNIEIDNNSGFCFGVVNAIQIAEDYLAKQDTLYCLGDIVHNGVEVERLKKMGLVTIDHNRLKELSNCKVLIRAHGEPPETYNIAKERNIELIDASCPVVLKLQKRIQKSYDETLTSTGQVVIYGKKGHAEVNGLVGQTQGKAIVVSDKNDLDNIDFSQPVHLYSQTTKSPAGFKELETEIKRRMELENPGANYVFNSNNTVCGQVSGRDKGLRKFAQKHNVVIFVSGKKSSNGKMLYEVCKEENPSTYFVSNVDELKKAWFVGVKSTGVCGATSTPKWLMEKIAAEIAALKY